MPGKEIIVRGLRVEVKDETVSQGRVKILDFAGAGVTAAVSADGETGTVTIAGGGAGHTIKEAGVAVTQRAGLNFLAGFDVADDAVGDESDVSLDLSEIAAGGELGGNMDAPTVAPTHSGSAHHSQDTDLVVASFIVENPESGELSLNG